MLFTPEISPLGELARPCRNDIRLTVMPSPHSIDDGFGKALGVCQRDWTVGTATMPQEPAARPARRKIRAARIVRSTTICRAIFRAGGAVPGKINPDIASSLRRWSIHPYASRRLTRNNWRDYYRNNSCHAATRQSNRLAANKHRSTVPDVTVVTAILMRPATAVETTGIGRSVGRSDFGLRF